MKKWNVAIIGLGFVGKLHYDALRRLPNVMLEIGRASCRERV